MTEQHDQSGSTRPDDMPDWFETSEAQVASTMGLRPLSPRELQVAILTAEGLSTEELAVSLGIGEGTVKTVRQAIRRKLGISRGSKLGDELAHFFGPRLTTLSHHLPRSGVASEPPRSADAGRDVICRDEGDTQRGEGVPAVERRVHLTLRQAIWAVEDLRNRLEARSEAMRRAAERTPGSRTHLMWEADQLEFLSDSLSRLREGSIARARGGAAAAAS
jgi:DNA-binding CsgD family transcriptional regulator